VVQQVYNARPIRRWIQKSVATQLSKMLVRGEIGENSRVYIDATTDREDLTYRVEKNGGLVNGQTGQKSGILIQLPGGATSSKKQWQ
jgi:ATP-dependent Clp protease ATP-binding subunit ClpB